jgi:dienelactone hydrolase
MSSSPGNIDGFELQRFEALGIERSVYYRGDGPGVLVMHEVPGITPPVAAFARRVADAGYRVALPHLFGVPNRPASTGYMAAQLARACVSREFRLLAGRSASPLTEWLRRLSSALHEQVKAGGVEAHGIAAIGMCITGNFALALMVDPWVMAPVLSQPSLPVAIGPLAGELHVDDAALPRVRERAQREAKVLGLRFTGDLMCPSARFERLRAELGEGFEAIEIDSSVGNAHGIPRTAHSVLALDFVDEQGHPTRAALDRVLAYLAEQLTSS